MELRQLRYFVAVAEELHFVRAAERLHIAQQSLSFQIKQLEHELGVQLFQRTTRHVELTLAGQAFLMETQRALEHLGQGIEAAQRAERGETGRLVIGYHSTTLYNVLPAIVRRFREQFPDVELVLRELVSPFLEEQILRGEIDLGLRLVHSPTAPELSEEVIGQEILAMALPKDHPLAACEGVKLTDFADEAFIIYSRAYKRAMYDTQIALFQNSGFSPNIVQEVTTEQALIGLVAAGVGVAVVGNSLNHVRTDEVAYRMLIDPVIQFDIAVVWKSDHSSPLIAAFLTVTREVAPSVF